MSIVPKARLLCRKVLAENDIYKRQNAGVVILLLMYIIRGNAIIWIQVKVIIYYPNGNNENDREIMQKYIIITATTKILKEIYYTSQVYSMRRLSCLLLYCVCVGEISLHLITCIHFKRDHFVCYIRKK